MQTVDITFNSHEKYKALLAKGFSEEQAEGIVETFAHIVIPNVATKEDLSKVETELKNDIVKLRTKLTGEIIDVRSELKEDVSNLEVRLTKLIYINTFTIIGVMAAITSIATAIIKFF